MRGSGIVSHAALMVGRNAKSYRLLSVTIILSFSLLLGYLVYADSNNYNKYKELFSVDRGMVCASFPASAGRDALMIKKVSEIADTNYQIMYSTEEAHIAFAECADENGNSVVLPGRARVWSVPRHSAAFYSFGADIWKPVPITWLDGKNHPDIRLAPDEIIVDEQLYSAFGLAEKERFAFSLMNTWDPSEGALISGSYKVVGIVPSESRIVVDTETTPGKAYISSDYVPELLFSADALSPATAPNQAWWANAVFYSGHPETVTGSINSLFQGIAPAIAVYEEQDRANESLMLESRTKAIICAVLLLLLGINLYSCFMNALNERKFEIGVKRAVGASMGSIVVQFLAESLIVMVVNIVVSVAVVVDLFIVYKLICERSPDAYGNVSEWIIYISPYSIALFAVCSAALTVVFSLIFAGKSAGVNVADQLKAE